MTRRDQNDGGPKYGKGSWGGPTGTSFIWNSTQRQSLCLQPLNPSLQRMQVSKIQYLNRTSRIYWHGSWRYLQLTFRLFRVPHTPAEHPLLQHAPRHVLQRLPHTKIAENLCRIISLAPSQGKVVYTFSTAQDRVEFVSTVEHFNGFPHTSLREPSSPKYLYSIVCYLMSRACCKHLQKTYGPS
jgi:hypothetical protein